MYSNLYLPESTDLVTEEAEEESLDLSGSWSGPPDFELELSGILGLFFGYSGLDMASFNICSSSFDSELWSALFIFLA